MKRLLVSMIVSVLVACTGCATTTSTLSPAQQIYRVQGTYAAALEIAVRYVKLPRCGDNAPVVCSDPATVNRIQDADDKAFIAIDAAQKAVRSPGFGEDRTATLTAAASAAVNALAALAAQLKVSP